MKKNSSYMTRALQARDPRFAEVLGKLGHKAPAEELPEVSMGLLKDDLLAIAAKEGVEIEAEDTKADLVRKIKAARN